MDASSTAILIDFENLILGLQPETPEEGSDDMVLPLDVSLFFRLAEEEGPVAIAQAYADWRLGLYNRHQVELYKHGVELVHVLGRNFKNAVDVRMAVDAVEMIYERPHIKTYVVVSGDRDFIHVLKVLRKNDKRVIGVAPARSASEDLAGLCDRFVTYRALWRTHHEQDEASEPGEPWEDLKARIAILLASHAGEEGLVGAQMKPLIRRHLSPTFDEANYGFSKLTNLLRAMPDVVRVDQPVPDGDVRIYPLLDAGEAQQLAQAVGASALVTQSTDPMRRFLTQARERLIHWRYEWSPATRRELLAAIHEVMVAEPPFTQDEIIHAIQHGPIGQREGITTTQIARYLSICYQSLMFHIEQNDKDLPVRTRRLTLREEYEALPDFVARYEQSIVYKIGELLPEDPHEALCCTCRLLGFGDADEAEEAHLTYVRALLERATRRG